MLASYLVDLHSSDYCCFHSSSSLPVLDIRTFLLLLSGLLSLSQAQPNRVAVRPLVSLSLSLRDSAQSFVVVSGLLPLFYYSSFFLAEVFPQLLLSLILSRLHLYCNSYTSMAIRGTDLRRTSLARRTSLVLFSFSAGSNYSLAHSLTWSMYQGLF